MTALLAVMSALSSLGIFYFAELYTNWYYYPLLIVFFVVLYWVSFVVVVLFSGIVGLFFSKKKDVKKPNAWFYWVTFKGIIEVLRFLRVKVRVTGLEKLPEGSFVAVYNHRSFVDPFILMATLPVKRIVMISKPENEKIPIVGKHMHYSGFMTIDRKSPMKARKTVEKSAAWVREGIASVAVSPEGTRSKTAKLLPFRAAPFSTAKKAESSIVVTTMTNTEKVFKNFPWRKTVIELHIVEVVPVETVMALSSFDLSANVREMMLTDLHEVDSFPPAKKEEDTES